jgi:hypothetical protein
MSHELEDNIERRKLILAKVRQRPNGINLPTLVRIIMEMGYNLRGAREKVKELQFGGWLKEREGHFFDSDALARKREEGEGGEGSGVNDEG